MVKKMSPKTFREFAERSLLYHRQRVAKVVDAEVVDPVDIQGGKVNGS